MSKENCKLCQISIADKKNSHIINKSISKELFQPQNFALRIDKTGGHKKVQDTPKENNLLCSNCEKRIEKIETYFSNKKQHLEHDLKSGEQLIQKLGMQEFVVWNDISSRLHDLYIYSLIWRASVTNLPEFNNFKLPQMEEEILRNYLDINLQNPLSDTFIRTKDISSFRYVQIFQNEVNPEIKGIYSCYSLTNNSHILCLVSTIILFYSSVEYLKGIDSSFSNGNNEFNILVVASGEKWSQLQKSIMSKLLN